MATHLFVQGLVGGTQLGHSQVIEKIASAYGRSLSGPRCDHQSQ